MAPLTRCEQLFEQGCEIIEVAIRADGRDRRAIYRKLARLESVLGDLWSEYTETFSTQEL
jgi:hypothetical protein